MTPTTAPPKLSKFKAWLTAEGFSAATISQTLMRVRWGFTKLGWDQGLTPEEGAARLGRYLTLIPKADHTVFRYAWKLFRAFAATTTTVVPALVGGHGDEAVRKDLARATVTLLAALGSWRVRCKHLVALTWDDLARYPAAHGEPIVLRAPGHNLQLPAWHLVNTFGPICAWSQPWANITGLDDGPTPGPIFASRPGSSRAMSVVGLQRILGHFGYPVTPYAAMVYEERLRVERGRALDAETVAIEARHDAERQQVEALAQDARLEQLWDETFPQISRGPGLLTSEEATYLGTLAVRAWQRRQEAGVIRAFAAEATDPGEHLDEMVAAMSAATGLPRDELLKGGFPSAPPVVHSATPPSLFAGFGSAPPLPSFKLDGDSDGDVDKD